MKITLKLFFTLFGLITLVVLVSLALARWSFQQGFFEFVEGLEQDRLKRIAGQLKEEYIADGYSWESLRSEDADSLAEKISGAGRATAPPERGHRGDRRPPPPRHGHRPPPPSRRASGYKSFVSDKGPPTVLYDQDGELVIGDGQVTPFGPAIELNLYAEVTTGERQLIGVLRSWPGSGDSDPQQSKFSSQQFYTSLLIGLVCLVLAGFVSWLAATRLLKPIRGILNGISELSNGRYSVTFSDKRKDELGQLMADISSLSDTLERNRSAKNRWFADISHELRTPLTVLSGEIELLKAGVRPFDQQQLQSFEQEISLLRHLIDDLYDLSLSDVGGLKYHFSQQSLLNSLAIVLDSMEKQAEEKNLSLDLKVSEDNLLANIDQKRIEQLLRNLCANSIAYTDGPGQILFAVSKHDDKILLSVDDSKPGVSEAECALLFDPLYRQDASRTRRESGAGLGLTISKNVVEAHGGNIKAMPSELGGLRIEVQLPASKGEQP